MDDPNLTDKFPGKSDEVLPPLRSGASYGRREGMAGHSPEALKA